MSRTTPMMRQYHRIKKHHQDAILLYHMGDFYEMFFEDAEIASSVLNIALTTRDRKQDEPIPLCGIPCHAAESYVNRLLKHGHKVAICDQVEDAASSKGLVRREVTRIITPGTLLDDRMIEGKDNNFLVAVNPGKTLFGFAALDISTGEFYLHEIPSGDPREIENLIGLISPSEVLLPEDADEDLRLLVSRINPKAPPPALLDNFSFDRRKSMEALLEQFQISSLESFGCQHFTSAVSAAGALLSYVQDTQRRPLANLVKLTPFSTGESLTLDSATRRNLELISSSDDGRREGSLLWVLDHTVTSMGARKLRSWVLAPMTVEKDIGLRLDAVEELVNDRERRESLRAVLSGILDLERLSSRISLNSTSPRDLASLRNSLRRLPSLSAELRRASSVQLAELAELDTMADLCTLIEERLVEEPPLKLKEGGLIRESFSAELDELRGLSRDGRQWLSSFEKQERERTGISSLKVGFNRVYGYYIEITKASLGEPPPEYSRRQTLVNAERFQTPELTEFEAKILGAEEKIAALEYSLFEDLRRLLSLESARLQRTASSVAAADSIQSLAVAAVEHRFCRPTVSAGHSLDITAGRHPVVEALGEERFVPNDCRLDSADNQVMILTGPNMAGKSTYLRQVALTTLLAQMGSFVPAEEAHIGIVDRIFTRIGATDKLSRGQSTFMVEMIETAAILHHATDRSLVILDEVGRGTSTFDGLSIAWAVVEYLHGDGERGPKTLFATHYHQLTELPLTLPRARNFSIAVREWESRILFLRKIVEGGTDKSYGIQVAQLAGLPPVTLKRARQILENLESGELNLDGLPRLARKSGAPAPAHLPEQMDIFPSPGEKLLRKLKNLDLENTTPVEALLLLAQWKENIDKKEN